MEEDVADLSSIAWWEVVPRSEGRGGGSRTGLVVVVVVVVQVSE